MKFAFITTCMGRLAHAKLSSRQFMEDLRIDGENNFYVFVDYCCPEGSGDWIGRSYSKAHVIKQPPPEDMDEDLEAIFHKSHALNLGAIAALNLGADYLVFLDVDCLITTEFLDAVFKWANKDSFLIFMPEREQRDLCGFLGIPKDSFICRGGFDTRMIGWGAEDLDMRLRLFLAGLYYTVMPISTAHSISHGDLLRTQYTPFDNKQDSNQRNLLILNDNVRKLTGRECVDLMEDPKVGTDIKNLLGLNSSLGIYENDKRRIS